MTKRYGVEKKTFHSPYPFYLYLPEKPGRHPLVFITPLLGRLVLFEDLHFEKGFARFFARHGIAACLIDRPIFDFQPGTGLEQIQGYLDESLIRNRTVLNAVLAEKGIDPERLGTFGVSFGAILNCLWAEEEPRFKANVFVLAGGNLPEIFVTSRDPLMKSYRQAAEKKSGLRGKALAETLRQTFTRDPLQAAAAVKGKNLLVLALFDHVVRLRYGIELGRRLPAVQKIFLPLGHYLSVLAVPLLEKKVFRFFFGIFGKIQPPS